MPHLSENLHGGFGHANRAGDLRGSPSKRLTADSARSMFYASKSGTKTYTEST